MWKKNPHYIKETIRIKDTVVKSLLFLSGMWEMSLCTDLQNLQQTPNLNHLPTAHLARNTIPCFSYSSLIVGCWERTELLCPPLSAAGLWLFPASRTSLSSCRVPQFSAKGRIPFLWVRTISPYSCTTVRSGASITNPTKSLVKQSSQVPWSSGLLTLILQWLCSYSISNCFLFCLLMPYSEVKNAIFR